MRVAANGQEHELADGATLGGFLASLGLDARYVVVERNGEVVARADAADTVLADGDRLIVVRAVAGGATSRLRNSRRERLGAARLYVVTDARRDRGDLEAFLDAVCGAGTDVVQLRDKHADDDALRSAADVFRRVADRHGTLFVLNDRPTLAAEVGADGVHVGQDDATPAAARAIIGEDAIIGRSTHSPAQLDAAAGEDVDYVAVGPIHETPTKQGRPAIGLDPVRYASAHATHPWFAIGGVNLDTVGDVRQAGASRIVVVRAVTQADDPADAAARLRAEISIPSHSGA